jgi:hypothetical protein
VLESVEADCTHSTDGRRLTCEWVSITVRPRIASQEIPAKLEKYTRGVTPENLGKACEGGAEFKDILPVAHWWLLQEIREGVVPVTGYYAEYLARWEAICRKPTREGFSEFVQFWLTHETRTCQIGVSRYEEPFVRQPSGQWTSQYMTLEPVGESRVLWKYTGPRNGFAYAFQPYPKALTCEFIEFGW